MGLHFLKPDLTQKKELPMPEKPLPIAEIEQLDVNECLRLIEERHHIPGDAIFIDSWDTPLPKGAESMWDPYYLTQLALMRLEGVPTPAITDFFAHEFSLLSKKDKFVAPGDIHRMSKYFSEPLKEAIRKNDAHLGWRVMAADLDNEEVLRAIEAKIKMPRERFLASRAADNAVRNRWGIFSQNEILRAFLMRVPPHSKSYSGILRAFGREAIIEDQKLLAVQVRHAFSEEAREFLPSHITKPALKENMGERRAAQG